MTEHFGGHMYEIVNRVPKNYYVWNIGEYLGTDDYIPFAETLPNAEPGKYSKINAKTLKAVKLPLEEVMLLRAASNWGIDCLDRAMYITTSMCDTTLGDLDFSCEHDCLLVKQYYYASRTLNLFKKITEIEGDNKND